MTSARRLGFAAVAAGLVVASIVVYVATQSDEATSPTASTEPTSSTTTLVTEATPPTAPTPTTSAAEAELSVSSGSLVAERGARDGSTWSMRLTDRASGEVLRTIGSGIVVSARSRREQVTTVVRERFAGGGYNATLQTATGRRITVTARPGAEPFCHHFSERSSDICGQNGGRLVDGVISVSIRAGGKAVRSVAVDLAAPRDERFFGLGQRATGVEHRGRIVENRVLDGPYTADQLDIVEGLVPEPGFSRRRDATYFPIPWVLSSRGYGVLVDNDETGRFELATRRAPDRWRVEVDANRLDLRIIAGPTPAAALGRMTEVIGRQPPAAAPFVYGPWWQASDDEVAELAALRRADVPLSVAQTYTHYLPCGDERGKRGDERARTRRLHAAGLAVTTYVNPMVCVGLEGLWDRGVGADALTRAPDGSPLRYRYSTSTAFEVGQFDFSVEAGRRLFETVLDDTVEDGYDGWMEDFGEYTPTGAVSGDGTDGAVMHNRYVEQYHAAAARYASRAPRPLARFNRSGWTGAVAHSSIVWGGDPTSRWGFDGLSSALSSGLGMGLSGVSRWGSDIGGFFIWPDDELTPELLTRWIEFGALSGVMRLQAGGISLSTAPRATVLDPEVLPVWRRYTKLRTQLYPYVAGADEQYRTTGLPVMRHLVLVAPDDDDAVAADDQYLFGADLLVAPVVEPGARARDAYLPHGEWIDLWRSTRIDDDGALHIGDVTTRPGGRSVTVTAPLHEIPIHVRAGAVLPLLPADVETLSPYGDGVVGLDDASGRRRLLAFPRRDWQGPLGAGETISSMLDGDRWTLAIHAARPRTYSLEASMDGLTSRGTPCAVTVDGDDVAFDLRGDVLTAELGLGRTADVVVRLCT